jgi:glycerol-3-phosphate O-acyltransferase
LQRKIRSSESVSKVLFETALKLAGNRNLLDPTAPDLVARRKAFAGEIDNVIRRIDAIATLAAARFAGLLP